MTLISFEKAAWQQYCYWQQHDRKLVKKINTLIEDIRRHPFEGIGKPEPLKNELAGFWSRRITDEHRLIYIISKDHITIAQCRYHY